MKEATRNLLVGTFLAASLVALATLMVLFGEAPSWLGGGEWDLRITNVANLSGLAEGSPVVLNGVEIGRVKRLEFEDPSRPHQGVVIVAGIKMTYHVPESAIARVYGATLGFGSGRVEIICEPVGGIEPLDRELAIIPGTMSSPFGDVISSEFVNAIESAIQNIGAVAGATTPVMENISALTTPRSAADVDNPDKPAGPASPTVATIIERVDDLVAGLNKIVTDQSVQGDVKSALSNLRAAAIGLRVAIQAIEVETRRTSQNLNAGINATTANLQVSFVALNAALGSLDDGLSTLARLLRHVESGEGSAGRFIHDDRLYEAAVLALERVGELAGTLQRIVGKVEQDGFLTIGKATPIGFFSRDVPVPELVEVIRSKLTDRAPTNNQADGTATKGSQ